MAPARLRLLQPQIEAEPETECRQRRAAEIDGITPMVTIAVNQGFILGVDFMSVAAEGGEHDARFWAHRFPDMLRFLYGT